MYGTTHNEAFHSQLKPFYRNIMIETARDARTVSAVATTAKLIAGYAKYHTILTTPHEDHESLRAAAAAFVREGGAVRPKMNHEAVHHPAVDQDALPPYAKRLRKRPAAGAVSGAKRLCKRPAAGASSGATRSGCNHHCITSCV